MIPLLGQRIQLAPGAALILECQKPSEELQAD